jgi:hypothetical protein
MEMRSEGSRRGGCRRAAYAMGLRGLPFLGIAVLLAACQPETKVQAPEVRRVRTVNVVKRDRAAQKGIMGCNLKLGVAHASPTPCSHQFPPRPADLSRNSQ